jgi:nicotinamidase-related amidase
MKPTNTIILILIFALCSIYAKSQETDIFENKYLIVLDMQEDYIVGKIPDSVANEFVENVNRIISKVDTNRIVYVKTEMIVASLSFKGVSVDTIADLEFCKKLKIVNNNIFIKEGGNAFANNDLADFFMDKNTSDIIIIGLLAEKCVSHTANGGLELGHNIYIIPSAILGKKERTKNKSIKKLINNGAKVITLNDLENR